MTILINHSHAINAINDNTKVDSKNSSTKYFADSQKEHQD